MNIARYSVIVAFVVTLAIIAGGVFMRLSAQLTLSAPTISDITQTSVTISWTTDVPATTQVSYGTTYNYTDKTSRIDTLTTEHTQTLSGLAPGTIYHYLVESGNGTSLGANGDNTFTTLAAADTPPTIALNVYATSPATWRPGGRGYYTWSITDDKSLQSVVITTSQMMYSGTSNDVTYQCQGKTFCEEKVYVIVPSNPGAQFVTVTAMDSANQTSTKTVTFDASACTTDADCGGGAIQWAGASYCGSESDGFHIMQYGVAAACKSGGICDTSSLPRVKQTCPSDQACSMVNFTPTCIQKPSVCSINAPITTSCICAANIYNSGYCCSGNWGVFQTAPGPCPAPSSPSSASLPTCPKSPPNPYASCSCGGVTYNTSNSYCCINSTTGKEYQSATTCSTVPPTQTASTASSASASIGGSPTSPATSPSLPSAELPTPSVPTTVPSIKNPSAFQSVNERTLQQRDMPVHGSPVEQEKRLSIPGSKKEEKLLKGKIIQAKKKIASIERKILSFEKKIDRKLLLLDHVKSEAAQKKVHAQIDRWEQKIVTLELQKEKKEAVLEDLQVSLEQLKFP